MKEQIEEQGQAILGATQSMLELSAIKTRGFDPVSLWERVGGDMDLLRDLVAIFTEECPGMLARIEAAITQGSAADLQKSSHKMKGSVLQFSASEAAKLSSQLEEMGRTGTLTEAASALAQLKTEIAVLMETLTLMVYRGAPQ